MVKKGFTLIELLAVIVILAILTLIATPIVVQTIEDSKIGAFRNSVYGIIASAENVHAKQMIKTGKSIEIIYTYTDGVEVSNPSGFNLDYKGMKPSSGTIIIDKNGSVALALHNGTYCAEKEYENTEVTISKKSIEECKLVTNYIDNSGAPSPEISEGMIPVKWDGSQWVKANLKEKWYDYDAKEWANVVLVTQEKRDIYEQAEYGTVIIESDVLAYLVWIPRYRYKLFNVEFAYILPREIEIEFENKSTVKSTGSSNGEWLTHPAFTFGEKELNGFWVGKFKMGGNAETPVMKANETMIKYMNVSTMFNIAKKFNNSETYGLTNAVDAHLMKNMEWGAIAY